MGIFGVCTWNRHTITLHSNTRKNQCCHMGNMGCFPHGYDRMSDRNSLREEGVILVHGLRVCQSVVELSLPNKTATVSF